MEVVCEAQSSPRPPKLQGWSGMELAGSQGWATSIPLGMQVGNGSWKLFWEGKELFCLP